MTDSLTASMKWCRYDDDFKERNGFRLPAGKAIFRHKSSCFGLLSKSQDISQELTQLAIFSTPHTVIIQISAYRREC